MKDAISKEELPLVIDEALNGNDPLRPRLNGFVLIYFTLSDEQRDRYNIIGNIDRKDTLAVLERIVAISTDPIKEPTHAGP